MVAPYAGAWIETRSEPGPTDTTTVAPYAGAWIETRREILRLNASSRSLPTRERGLKRRCPAPYRGPPRVAPYAGAWIETPART